LPGYRLLLLDADVTGGASVGHKQSSHGLQVVVLPGLVADADGHHGRIVQVEQLTVRVERGDRAGESRVDTENNHGAFPGTS
jgi:hypothetical protein